MLKTIKNKSGKGKKRLGLKITTVSLRSKPGIVKKTESLSMHVPGNAMRIILLHVYKATAIGEQRILSISNNIINNIASCIATKSVKKIDSIENNIENNSVQNNVNDTMRNIINAIKRIVLRSNNTSKDG